MPKFNKVDCGIVARLPSVYDLKPLQGLHEAQHLGERSQCTMSAGPGFAATPMCCSWCGAGNLKKPCALHRCGASRTHKKLHVMLLGPSIMTASACMSGKNGGCFNSAAPRGRNSCIGIGD